MYARGNPSSVGYSVQLWFKVPEQFGGGEIRSNVITVQVK